MRRVIDFPYEELFDAAFEAAYEAVTAAED